MTDPLRAIDQRQRREIRQLYRVLADAISNATARQEAPGRVVTESDRLRIMREVDGALDVLWGARKGDTDAAIRQIIMRDTQAARVQPLAGVVEEWKREMGPALTRRVEEEARDG